MVEYTRRAIPMRVAIVLARVRARRAWNRERTRREALETVRAVVGSGPTQEELEELARAHILENEIRTEFFWRPWAIEAARIDGRHHLREALATGRGVIVSYCHLGPHAGPAILARKAGAPRVHVAAGKVLFDPRKKKADQRYQRQHRVLIERGGGQPVPATGGFETLASLLREREVIGVAFDVAGRTPTPFLGRTAHLTSGTARLATAADALVVPLLRRCEGHRMVGVMSAAFDPRDHEGMDELHLALARHHDTWIATNPAALRRSSFVRRLTDDAG